MTAAETAECALGLVALGRREQAASLLEWAQEHRCPDGSYMTGLVYPEQSSYPPDERTTYTAAAVVSRGGLPSTGPARRLSSSSDGSLPCGLDLDAEPAQPPRSTRRLPISACVPPRTRRS